MGHRTISKAVKENFHYDLLVRGEEVVYVPVSSLIDWVKELDDAGKIQLMHKKNDGAVEFVYQIDIEEEFPVHYHDQDEVLEVLSGSMKFEYLDDKRYTRTTISKGDVITMDRGEVHRATALEPMRVKLTFLPNLEK